MKHQQAQVYYQVGNDNLRVRNYLRAIKCYKDAIGLYPMYFKAYCNMGVAYKNAGMLKDAEVTFERALKLKPRSGVVFNNLGNVYTVMGRFDEAKLLYIKAIKVYPAYKEAYYNLGQAYYFSGEADKAVQMRVILEKLKLAK